MRVVGCYVLICQDENEPEDETFRSFWIKPVTNEQGLIALFIYQDENKDENQNQSFGSF